MPSKKILIADDDMDLLEQLETFLVSSDFSVTAVSCEKDAREQIEKNNYDLAIYDLMMENQDSGFVLSHLTKNKNSETPVILMTSVTRETGFEFDLITKGQKTWIKVDAILQKDIRFEQLKSEIKKLLK